VYGWAYSRSHLCDCCRSASGHTVSRVTTSLEYLENLEMSGNLTAVREMSGILLKVRELSGKKSC